VSLTGGTIQGAGTIKGNTSSSAAINVGDAGKAGLLSITGTYTQLSTGTLNVSIGGTTVGTQYSQLKVSGTASLGGTLTAALVNAFTPTVGQTFTILTASSVSGTFTNSTIAINSSEHFAISYTATSVVLTVVSGPASTGSSSQPMAQMAMAPVPSVSITAKPVKGTSTLSRPVTTALGKTALGKTKISKPVLVASAHNNAILAAGGVVPRIWDPVMAKSVQIKSVPVPQLPRRVSENVAGSSLDRSDLVRSNLTRSANNWTAQSHVAPVGNWAGVHNMRPEPVRIMKPVLPKMR